MEEHKGDVDHSILLKGGKRKGEITNWGKRG